MRSVAAVSTLGLAILVGAHGLVYSQQPTRLVYARRHGAESCPDAQDLRHAVADRMGRDPFFVVGKQTIIAEISGEEDGFRGKIQVIDEASRVRGERTVSSYSSDCTEMVRVLALAISIAIDDLETASAQSSAEPSTASSSAPVGSVSATSAPPTIPAPPMPAAVAPSTRTPPSYHATLGPLVSWGAAPSTAAGLAGGVEMRLRSLGIAAEGRFDLPASSSIRAGGSVWSSLALGSGVLCARPSWLFGCAVASIGTFRGGGTDIAVPRTQSVWTSQLGVRVGAERHVTAALSVAGHAEVAFPTTRNRIDIDQTQAFRQSLVMLSVGIRGVVHF